MAKITISRNRCSCIWLKTFWVHIAKLKTMKTINIVSQAKSFVGDANVGILDQTTFEGRCKIWSRGFRIPGKYFELRSIKICIFLNPSPTTASARFNKMGKSHKTLQELRMLPSVTVYCEGKVWLMLIDNWRSDVENKRHWQWEQVSLVFNIADGTTDPRVQCFFSKLTKANLLSFD